MKTNVFIHLVSLYQTDRLTADNTLPVLYQDVLSWTSQEVSSKSQWCFSSRQKGPVTEPSLMAPLSGRHHADFIRHSTISTLLCSPSPEQHGRTWLLGMRLGDWCPTDRETLSGCCFKTVIVPLLLCLMRINKTFPHSTCIFALLAAGMSVPAWLSYPPFTWLCTVTSSGSCLHLGPSLALHQPSHSGTDDSYTP